MTTDASARRAWKSSKGLVFAGFALIAIVAVVAISGLGRSHDAAQPSSNAAADLSGVKLGMTEPQIRQILGEPNSTRHSEADGVRSDTWRYVTLRVQFLFKNSRLTARSRY